MTITAKYPGKCGKCGARIPKGARIEWHGRGRGVTCASCAGLDGGDGAELQDGPRLDTDGTPIALVRPYPGARRSEWRRGYEATGHRCEDAPCCGCCS